MKKNQIRKKILLLTLSATVMASITGCSNDEYSEENEDVLVSHEYVYDVYDKEGNKIDEYRSDKWEPIYQDGKFYIISYEENGYSKIEKGKALTLNDKK